MRRFWCLILSVCLVCMSFPAFADGFVTPSEPDPGAQGWIVLPDSDGAKKYGDIAELVALAHEGGEIFVQEKRAVELKDIFAALLVQIEFTPDPDVFSDGEYIVRTTFEDPDEAEDLTLLEDIDRNALEDDPQRTVTVYVWVMQVVEEQPSTGEGGAGPGPEPTPEPEKIEISVTHEGYVQGAWTSAAPRFTLSGVPEERGDLHYAVILYDRQIVELEDDTFIPQDEGIIALRFAIMDRMGDILSSSESYTLYLDMSVPEAVSVMPSQKKSYAMILAAEDSLSGVAAVSVDTGATWEEIAEGQPFGYAFGCETILEPGMLCVKDNAGNIWTNEEPLLFGTLIEDTTGGGGYSAPAKPHAENTSGNDGETGYDQAYLYAGEEPVAQLALTGRQLSLTVGETESALFTMAFGGEGGLSGLHTGEMDPADNILVLTPEPVETEDGEQMEYVWQFDGAAMRTLYATGIDTLVLRVGDAAAVLPTAGFTAGTRYTDLKISGTGSRYFLYSARMSLIDGEGGETRLPDEINRTDNCLFALDVVVKEEQFTLVPAQGEEMYAEGVYCIPQEWIGLPEEEWPQSAEG